MSLVACEQNTPELSNTPSNVSQQQSATMILPSLPPSQTRALVNDDASATPFPTNTPMGCETNLEERQVHYALSATLDWNTKQMGVLQTVTYRNDSDTVIHELVFYVEPRRLQGVMQFRSALDEAGNEIPNIEFDGWRLSVPLPERLFPNCSAKISLLFNLNIGPYSSTNPIGWLSYTDRQVNIGHWFPTVGLYGYQMPGVWYTPRMHFIGEQSITVLADYDLQLSVQNAPANLTLAAPGIITQTEPAKWQIEFNGGRELAMSLSTTFEKITTSVDDVLIELYYYPREDTRETGLNPAARAILDAEQAFKLYNENFSPYPHNRLVIVEGDFPDGMEFSGIVFVSEAWFRTWNGRVNDWLTIITVHEIAHQWWYSLIGTNQGQTPYLDEALATYSELLYYQAYYPEFVEWWWNFRVYTYLSEDKVDATVYDYSSWRPYINAVYLRGCLMFQALRETLGDEIFLAWLADYARLYSGHIASSQDFWSVLSPTNYDRVATIRQQYLKEADILPPALTNRTPIAPLGN
ncbi:MAG: hypothetical protein CUN55_06370 [Phototrophicales bacterium]|nr:MAG: hypothetical protein CUN55_06370 [Phototrophicales bacterium]